MGDSISAALALIDDRLEALHASMTEEPIDVVTHRYAAWKSAAVAALAHVVVDSVVRRFDLTSGAADHRDGHRPTPQVYLDGAASRAFLMALKEELSNDPSAVLLRPSGEPMSTQSLGLRTIVDLLERRLPKAFRGRPETERNLQDGFETLLAGAGIAGERESNSILHATRTYVPDFTFPALQTALELKLCHRPDREKEIIAEINEEIPAYRTRYPNIVFGVYDLGFMGDADRFSRTFQAHEGVLIRLMKL